MEIKLKKEWVEISEGKLLVMIQDDLRAGAERLTKKVKNTKLSRFQKLKGMQIGQTALKVVWDKMGSDYMELQVITKGIEKCKKELKKGKIVETDNLKENVEIKQIESSYFMKKI